MVLHLDKGIVEWHTSTTILDIEVDSKVDQDLLCFKSGISSRARHVDRKVKQVTSMLINLVDVSSFTD